MATIKASFGGGIELVNLDKRSSIPRSLVFQLPDKLTPTHVGDGFSQAVVLDHVLDLQTLDANRLVLTDQLCREFVLIITASIAYASVYSGNLETCLITVLGTFFLLGKTALSLCQLLLILVEE